MNFKQFKQKYDLQIAFILIPLSVVICLLHPDNAFLICLEIFCSLDILGLIFLGCDRVNLLILTAVIVSYLSNRVADNSCIIGANYLFIILLVPLYILWQDKNFFAKQKN